MLDARFESELKRDISNVILREIADPRVQWVSVLSVKLSRDKKFATVYISYAKNDENGAYEVLEALNNAAGFFRKKVSQQYTWRQVPRFVFDYPEEE